MKYRDLIQFEPVTEVIQLRWADEKPEAERLVSTYVISDRMADVILHRILPAVSLKNNRNGRGLFIVGNYGTGKSHLMSVITAVAEHADLLSKITHPAVANDLQEIAGKFKVVRQETGATQMHLRDVVLNDLEKQLGLMGVNFHFPSMEQASSNKQLLIEMMVEFDKQFPGQGLLIALDELLDFLRARDDRQLVMDLNFLREVGEACEVVPLRFITGIQEALFDNARFQFAAESIRRVRARFDQLSIVREDLAYVVSRRLLAKSPEQQRAIRSHLEKFTSLYTSMAERLDSFIELFPVHPAYLDVFEQVTIGERRDLLKALSSQMAEILELDVPENHPGLIAFDSYWQILTDDPAYRTIPEIRTVQDKVRVLTERINLAAEMKEYRPAALRIINGLAVQRLTVGDLYAPIGMTPVELRDRLCIHVPLPETDADFLLATIETVLKEITRVVSGQFISHNRENDQYYLDLKKDIDYDALIEQRAAALDENAYNRYYFELIARTLELTDSAYVPGFRIWQREIPWPGQGITRQGYIFLGAPNERSTAHPERDFYIHFLSLNNRGNSLNHLPDEIYFDLSNPPQEFLEILRGYAGAREMSAISSGSNKDQYDRKAETYSRQLSIWLRENLLRFYQVSYQNVSNPIAEAVARYRLSLRELSFRDQIFRLSGVYFASYFSQKYPDYPRFVGTEFTVESAHLAAEAALRAISGMPATKNPLIVLESLQLARLENNVLVWTVEESPYAAYYQAQLDSLAEGRVLNRSTMLQGEPGAERDVRFGLEIDWLLVVIAALVRQGTVQINLPGQQITEGETDLLSRIGLETLARFTSLGKPKALPEQALTELLANLDIDPALLKDPHVYESLVKQIQNKVSAELDQVVRALENLRIGPRFWREPIYSSSELQAMRSQLDAYRQYLDVLQRLNTPARLRNLPQGVGELRAAFKARRIIVDLNEIYGILHQLQPATEYLGQAEALLPSGLPWLKKAEEARLEILDSLRDSGQRKVAGAVRLWSGRLENLQNEYTQVYFTLHQDQRLDRTLDERKQRLTSDPRWARLRALSRLELLSERQLQQLQDSLGNIRSCPTLQPGELRTHAACPSCGFSPIVEKGEKPAGQRLADLENQFEQVYQQWVAAILANLNTPEAQQTLVILEDKSQQAVALFIQTKAIPDKITESFLEGLRDCLQGLEKVVIDSNEMLLELTRQGMPCTLDAFNERLRRFIAQSVEGKDPKKVRIDLDW